MIFGALFERDPNFTPVKIYRKLKMLLVPFRVEAIFRHKVFRILLAKRKVTEELIWMLTSWRH